MKERLGMTEMRKQANRMTFGEIEDEAYQQNLGFSLGQLGKKGTGRIRAAQVKLTILSLLPFAFLSRRV